jgi:hypothetical protein
MLNFKAQINSYQYFPNLFPICVKYGKKKGLRLLLLNIYGIRDSGCNDDSSFPMGAN